MKLVNKKNFTEAVLNHKEGFLISTGDADGDRNSAFELYSAFFDSAYMLGGNQTIPLSMFGLGNSILAFDNKLDTKKVDGKCVSSIYSLGNAHIDTNAITSVREYTSDQFNNYLSDTFAVGVQRVFEVEVEDEAYQTSNLYCIGLL